MAKKSVRGKFCEYFNEFLWLCKLLSGLASDSARLRIRLQLAQRQRFNYTGDTGKMEGSPLKHVTASDINRAESENPLAHAAESGNLMAHTAESGNLMAHTAESGNLLPMRQSPGNLWHLRSTISELCTYAHASICAQWRGKLPPPHEHMQRSCLDKGLICWQLPRIIWLAYSYIRVRNSVLIWMPQNQLVKMVLKRNKSITCV